MWAVGSNFEYDFDFPVVTQRLYGSAKPDQSKKRHTTSPSRPVEIEPAPKPNCDTTRKSKGTKLTPEERKERVRTNRAARASDARNSASAGNARTSPCPAKPAPPTAPRITASDNANQTYYALPVCDRAIKSRKRHLTAMTDQMSRMPSNDSNRQVKSTERT